MSASHLRCLFSAACLLALVLTAPVRVSAEEPYWNQFRGPHADGTSEATGLPTTWSEKENIVWKTPIHGRAWSSPVVWKDQVWVTTSTKDGKELGVVCVDFNTGKILIDKKIFDVEKPQYIDPSNSHASSTPIIEEGRIYVHYGAYGTACLDTKNGNILWERRDYPCNHWRGAGSSPIIYQNLLILQYDGYDYQYIVALDKETGKEVWKKDRDIEYGTKNGDSKKAFATPRVIEYEGRVQLISPAAKATVSYNPLTGEEYWKFYYPQHSAANRPLYDGEKIYVGTGFPKAHLYVVNPGGKGNVTDSHVKWVEQKGIPSKPSQLLIDGLIYMIDDKGIASCLDAEDSGKLVWKERMDRSSFSASPIYADGKIYAPDREGVTRVFVPGKEYKELAANQLQEGCVASLAVAGKSLILRTEHFLYRIEDQSAEK
ncbi:PQQ-binding-like beta-propeller repeat protein [Gimesia chilikensis]|uniref:outer membrane protein assembly factor BamB family protein n=1 Tax=Gimesia chilikensis TaxID=2605989 RepID=UPI0011ED0218|nr:PQQ-binding-like beta-propeller repeat protein [Gimesia chilikensis]KAA0141485.1 PQQ-binding-like beta-propeller repeat protein [Gimesia chilikensis]